MELIFAGDGRWSFDHDSYMLWATLEGKERIRCQLTREMFRDCCGIDDKVKAQEFAERYRITFLTALKHLAEAGGFSPGDEHWQGRQLILTSRNFLPVMGTKNPFVDGPEPSAGEGLAGDRWRGSWRA